jgi:hypothetical protein
MPLSIQCRASPDNRAARRSWAPAGRARSGLVARAQTRGRTQTDARDALADLPRPHVPFGLQPDSVMHVMGESRSMRRDWIPQSAVPAPTRPGAERATVNLMLPDFRFALGALLAITLLAVAGLGLATSVRLVHEARIGPLEDSHGLAYAGHAEWNQFYDPDGARRFEGLKKTEGPLAETQIETQIETPAETSGLAPVSAPIAPSNPVEQTASIPSDRPEPDVVPLIAPLTSAKTPEADLPPLVETPAAATIAAPPAAGAPAPDVPGQTGSGAPPEERVASAPAASPGADLREGTEALTSAPAQPQAGNPPPDATPPTPRARPKPHFRKKIVRAHFRRVAPANRQTVQNSGFSNAPWPGTDNQFIGATSKKSSGSLTTLSSRPQ